MVFEAGSGATSLSWLPVIRELSTQCGARLVAYDRLGIGASDPLAFLRRISLVTQVDDLAAVLEALSRTGGRCVLVAHSWGGLLAQIAAWDRPELIAGMVLVDASHELVMRQMPKKTLYGMLLKRAMWTLPGALGLGRRALRADSATWAAALSDDPDVCAHLTVADLAYYLGRRTLYTKLIGEMRAVMRSAGEIERRRSGPGAKLPVMPLVVLSSDPEAAEPGLADVVPALAAKHRELALEVPGARHELVREAGHFIQLDRPQVVVDAVREVLAKIA